MARRSRDGEILDSASRARRRADALPRRAGGARRARVVEFLWLSTEPRLGSGSRASPSPDRVIGARLDRDPLEHVGDRLARVDGGLERVEDVLPADQHHRVDAVLEQRRDGRALQPVALVLEPVDLDEVRRQLGAVAQAAQRGGDLLGAAHEHAGDLLRLLHRRLDAVEPELVGRLLGEVDDVVERARERVDVGGVERRAAVAVAGEPGEDVVGDPVALLLAEQDLAREGGLLGVVREQVAQQQRDALHVARGLLEQAEQLEVGLRLRRPHAGRP